VLRPAQRPARVAQQPPRLGGSAFGQVSEFPGRPGHRGLLVITGLRGPRPQLGRDGVRPLARGAAAVPHFGPPRPASGLDPPPGLRDPANGPGQQPRIGRVSDVRRHHRGIRAQPRGAQQLGPGRLGQQRLVQPVNRCAAAPGGQLHQRRGMRHRLVQTDPAKPPPRDRVADLRTQALKTQPVPELEEHQPQITLHRRRRPAQHRVEIRRERHKERRVIQQRVHPRQFLRQTQQLRRQQRLPRRQATAYSAKHGGLDHF